jgi:hypothetical protein
LLVEFYDLNIKLETTGPVTVGWVAGGLMTEGLNVSIGDVHVSGILHAGYLSSSAYGGGIAGVLIDGTVTDCSSKLNLKMEHVGVEPSPISSVGGLLGEMDGVTIKSSFSSGVVEGTWVGGILGAMGGFVSSAPNIISHCYSSGTVNGLDFSSGAIAGGIAGVIDGDVTGSILEASYSVAEITCEGSGYAGGIAGRLDSSNGTITGCLALNGSITGSALGRVVGSSVGTLLDNKGLTSMSFSPSYSPISNGTAVDGYDIDPSNPSDVAGTVLDLTMSGNVFVMPPSAWSYRYPVFQWQIDKGIQP